MNLIFHYLSESFKILPVNTKRSKRAKVEEIGWLVVGVDIEGK
ncbi:MAG TPA: hypothetical protein VK179_16410 [Bacteroidales bacterium]|nr:hypothetical protein [Bacteroidales bacterium]